MGALDTGECVCFFCLCVGDLVVLGDLVAGTAALGKAVGTLLVFVGCRVGSFVMGYSVGLEVICLVG